MTPVKGSIRFWEVAFLVISSSGLSKRQLGVSAYPSRHVHGVNMGPLFP